MKEGARARIVDRCLVVFVIGAVSEREDERWWREERRETVGGGCYLHRG